MTRALVAMVWLPALFATIPTPRAGAQAGDPSPALEPVTQESIARAVEDYLRDHPPAREAAPWETVFENLALYGDMRLRHESTFRRDGAPDRHRDRARIRLGVNYQLSEELLFGARLVTGDRHDPRSPHVTFGDGFDGLELSIDRAFLTYRPDWLAGAELSAGKFNHPFYRNPVYGELLWDADVQPEGALASYSFEAPGPLETITLRAGEYVLLEQSSGPEAFVSALQAQAGLPLTDGLRADLAIGAYLLGDPTPGGATRLVSRNAGNALEDTDGDAVPDDFVSDFRILNPILALQSDALGIPLTLSGELMHNSGATDHNDAWAIGLAAGSQRKQGDIRIYYQYQTVEQDAVFSPLVQDDFLYGTNHQSHVFGLNYQALDRLGLHLWCLVSRPDHTPDPATPDETNWRLRLDVNIRF